MERIAYDEFGMFHENAAEFGLPYAGPPVVRREFVEVRPGHRLSALVWGAAEPEVVLVHGGGQNAHTWDTVAMALGRPLIAIDLPGHGHSDGTNHSSLSLDAVAADVAVAVRALAPSAAVVVGMSLGGLTTLALVAHAPDLVRRLVLVDILPSMDEGAGKVISEFVNGPRSFDNFDDLLQRTIAFNPTRTVSSLRRGILHNAVQLDDGSWMWRHQRSRADGTDGSPMVDPRHRAEHLWTVIEQLQIPLLLVRGTTAQSVLRDEHEAELRSRRPSAQIVHVEGAGHSVQGDRPVELARLIEAFVTGS